MSRHHLVRIGVFGHVGRFTAVDAVSYPRGTQVVCRTSRGLEVGEVLGPSGEVPADAGPDGSLLRAVTPADQLLLTRLEKHKQSAYAACTSLLAQRGVPAVLMDVEHLFDGRTLYFYFLGETTPQIESITSELAEAYETQVQFRRFAQAVTEGCGPGCGTEEGAGCGTSAAGGCSTCAASGACGLKKGA